MKIHDNRPLGLFSAYDHSGRVITWYVGLGEVGFGIGGEGSRIIWVRSGIVVSGLVTILGFGITPTTLGLNMNSKGFLKSLLHF